MSRGESCIQILVHYPPADADDDFTFLVSPHKGACYMKILFAAFLSVVLASVWFPMPLAFAERCPACCTNNCHDCSACKPKLGDEIAAETMATCDDHTASLTEVVAEGSTDGSPLLVAVVKCSECMGKCATAYSSCRSQCAPNDRACLIQCQELSSQCEQNCKAIHQCE